MSEYKGIYKGLYNELKKKFPDLITPSRDIIQEILEGYEMIDPKGNKVNSILTEACREDQAEVAIY